IRRVSKGIANGGYVRAAPLADRKALGNLLGDKVAEHRKLASEVMVDADNFFLEVRRSVCTTKKPVAVRGSREDTGAHQGSGIGIDHTRGNGVTREWRALNDARGQHSTRAVLGKNGCCNLRGRGYVDRGRTEIAAISRRIRDHLTIVDVALNEAAPFHV